MPGPEYRIDLTVPNVPLVVPDRARLEVAKLIDTTIRLALQVAAGAISAEAPRDTGILAQSFGADPATERGGIELLTRGTGEEFFGRVFSSLPYAIVMEEGRTPGAPISRAGIDAIGLWAQRKLHLDADEAEHAKYAIAASIVARGIAGYHYFARGVDVARPKIEDLWRALNVGVQQALTAHG